MVRARALEMGARVTIRVRLSDGALAAGAEILGINHDSWSASHREWKGRTDARGEFTWDNLDTGTLGDRYTFEARYQDNRGVAWIGSASERINSPRQIELTLTPGFDGVAGISVGLKASLAASEDGRRLLELFRELDSSLREGMSIGSLALEVDILEQLVLLRLKQLAPSTEVLPGSPLQNLVSQTEIIRDLGMDRVAGILRFQETRSQVMHGRAKSVPVGELSLQGRKLCLDTLQSLFGA